MSVLLPVFGMLFEEHLLELLIGTVDVGLDRIGQCTFFGNGLGDVLVTLVCIFDKRINEIEDVLLRQEVQFVSRSNIEDHYLLCHRPGFELLLLEDFIKNGASLDLKLRVLIKIRTEL